MLGVMSRQCLRLQEAVSGPCSRCGDADRRVEEVECHLATVEHELQNERQIYDDHRKYIDELEAKLSSVADDVGIQVLCEYTASV